MKKYAPYIILFLFALLLWEVATDVGYMNFHIDGEEFDGPLGALLALLFAGGGTIIAGFVLLVVGVVLAVVFAGLGVLLLGALIVAAVAVALAISPLLLPLLVPLAIIWYLASRNRNRKAHAVHPAA
ncbi:hypothetical protein [Massilia yuzhufengensis]|uniref:Uncharacterized protein n=1 Tax=Massilia yuzhufengensis TaxID=1164594 RepID=A0A1I1P064_9BURK|nr:hypothetical protein [Massilia yuzhufengensis]SFD03115.1 hypothetical protein SAMN05216204_114105 [Massilia yuzhufengensis]